ncbi:hypothetical protein L1049_020949 [Liquidambar formosana]|uniref:Transposase MuDR plant domain-containing protein n=1 Tax=Liquidambar formosana TaxID=63359 RepID=A0AAP0SDF6_LIQFO
MVTSRLLTLKGEEDYTSVLPQDSRGNHGGVYVNHFQQPACIFKFEIAIVFEPIPSVRDFGAVLQEIGVDSSEIGIPNSTRFGVIFVYFTVPGHACCMLECDSDIQNMFKLVCSIGIDRVDVAIYEHSIITQDVTFKRGENHSVLQRVDCIDNEANMLSNYCRHEKKVLLSASWVDGIRQVGQGFEGGVDEFRMALLKYPIEVRFEYDFVKNTDKKVIALCKMRDSNSCMWHVHAALLKINNFFYIKALNNVHSCGSAVRTTNNSRVSSQLVATLIREKIRDKPLHRPVDVIYDMKEHYGIDITYHHAWWGVKRAKKNLFGDQSMSYDLLRWYKDEVTKTNPGSVVEIEYDSISRRFKRVFVSYYACKYGFHYCRPLLFLDGTFLKGRYKGNLLAATAKDGNQDGFHAYCLHHLKGNLRDKLAGTPNSYKERMVKLLTECAYALSTTSFNYKITQLLQEGGDKVRTFLHNLPPENWSNAHFKGQCYGEMWSNAAESFNSQIGETRHLPVTNLIDSIRAMLMNQMSVRREQSSKWETRLCPNMDARLQNILQEGRIWIVRSTGNCVFEVQSYPSVSVDIRKRICSCYQWQLNGFPMCSCCPSDTEKW